MSGPVPCIGAIHYAFPSAVRTVRELAERGQLESRPEVLEAFGFATVHVAVEETPYELARQAGEGLLAEAAVDPATVDLLLYGGAVGPIAFARPADAPAAARELCTPNRFRYPATRLQYELGLDRASVMGVDQLACASLFGAVRLARSLCVSEGLERVLCVASECFPALAGRETVFNCTSDAACAVLVERDGARNRLVAGTTVTKGYYWDPAAMRDEVVASYFPTARCVIERAIGAAGWAPADVDWVIPHNVSRRSWEILHRLAGLPRARLWAENIARDGHTLAGDNFINLRDALRAGAVRAGDRVLLFAYGYGAHWSALAMEA